MIRFTSAGAVQSPITLQVRVDRTFTDRVVAGAPSPSRAMAADEVLAAVRAFTIGSSGPRSHPCTQLVLSGVRSDGLAALPGVCEQGRAWGIERITVHAGPSQVAALVASGLPAHVDAVAFTVREPEDVIALAPLAGLFRTAVVLLDDAALGALDATVSALEQVRPERAVFTWPLPPSVEPPAAVRAADAIAAVAGPGRLAGVPWGIKGLPACRLGALADRLWRSANRWYVDAEHQGDAALLFFPDVLRFAKADVCRFCALDGRCDGAPEAWVRAGLAGSLSPVSDG